MDIPKHKINLIKILIDFYGNNILSSSLGFKGGTAAMLFYNLPRFSVDLDFDFLGKKENITTITEEITKLLSKKFEIRDTNIKYHTLFWLVSYKKGEHAIKVEISTRDNSYNHYTHKIFYGEKVAVLDIKDMIAHKMVAFTQRPSVANRDLFDIHFFLKSPFASEINYEVIKKRTGKNPKQFYKYMLENLERVNQKNILSGLGEVLTDSQKNWVKTKLINEVKNLIKMQIEFFSEKEN